jgi:hypothetical protein
MEQKAGISWFNMIQNASKRNAIGACPARCSIKPATA